MNDGYTSNGHIHNVIFKSTGRILSLNNVTYLCKKLQEDTSQHDRDLVES